MGKQLASPFRHIPLIRFFRIGTYYGTISPERKQKKRGLLKINTSHAVGKIYRPSARILEPRFACKCGSSRNIHAKPSPRSRKRSIIYLFLEHAGSDAVRFMGKPPVPNLGFFQEEESSKRQGMALVLLACRPRAATARVWPAILSMLSAAAPPSEVTVTLGTWRCFEIGEARPLPASLNGQDNPVPELTAAILI